MTWLRSVTTNDDDRSALERIFERGVFAGFVATAVMAVFAMVASATYQGRGLFTPMYHAAFIIDEETMGNAIAKAGAGDPFYFFRETFIFGMIAQLMVGGALGAVFALAAKRLRLHGNRALLGGLVYGFAVMVAMSLLVLPWAANLFGAGKPISRMGAEVGWPTFAAEFAIFGLALGVWVFLRPQDIGHPTRPGAADPAVRS